MYILYKHYILMEPDIKKIFEKIEKELLLIK